MPKVSFKSYMEELRRRCDLMEGNDVHFLRNRNGPSKPVFVRGQSEAMSHEEFEKFMEVAIWGKDLGAGCYRGEPHGWL